jgi:FAD/FMN-containing dehydrogenase
VRVNAFRHAKIMFRRKLGFHLGVGGWCLGGGYSLTTNQYGLGIDNIIGFQVVLPTGKIVEVEENDWDHQDLFEALKVNGDFVRMSAN